MASIQFFFQLVLLLALICCTRSFLSRAASSRPQSLEVRLFRSKSQEIVGKAILSTLAITLPLNLNVQDIANGAAPWPALVQPAHADVRAQQKRTYSRFFPKLIQGSQFYVKDLKQAIDQENWAVVEKYFETFVTKYNPNDPKQVDQTDTYVNQNLYRPMTVVAGTFAERGKYFKFKWVII